MVSRRPMRRSPSRSPYARLSKQLCWIFAHSNSLVADSRNGRRGRKPAYNVDHHYFTIIYYAVIV